MTSSISEISPIIREKAPLILAEIKKAKSILLHCHPSPDPDSVGSALAMKFALESMGKNVTVIRGDSEMPRGYRNFPGFQSIVNKNISEVDLKDFDLFVILDSAVETQISRFVDLKFPLSIRSVVIDHHQTNRGYADINLVDSSYPALCQILFELFQLWDIKITKEISKNLFVGIYTDTGGFKYNSTTASTLEVGAKLAQIAPDFHSLISDIQNTSTQGFITFEGIALSSIETFFGDRLAISAVPFSTLKQRSISEPDVRVSEVSTFMRTVPEWGIAVAIAEVEPNKIRVSTRCLQPEIYDVSKLMAAIGGGGHKAAAAAVVTDVTFDELKKVLVTKAKELYNL